MEPCPLNFSFPPQRPAAESAQPWLRRLMPVALLALAAHAFVLVLPASRRSVTAMDGRVPQPADDTPELLRLSRGTAQPMTSPQAPLNVLPPPPSDLPLPLASPNTPAVLKPTGVVLPAPPLPARLEDAATALGLLQRQLPEAALSNPDREAVAALQRRQWWLTGAQEVALQRIWQGGVAVDSVPDSLGKLPENGELRRLPAGAVPVLGTGDWHGHSLVGRQAALLLWRQAGSLWLLRLPLSSAQTLTSS